MLASEEVPNIPLSTTVTRSQILSAQFECYLKIIYDPPRNEAGEALHTRAHTYNMVQVRGEGKWLPSGLKGVVFVSKLPLYLNLTK